MAWIVDFLKDPVNLIWIVGIISLGIGSIAIKKIKLGGAASLFVGLAFGHFGFMVPYVLVSFMMPFFFAVAGLLASRDIGRVLRVYGVKFLILAIMMPLFGAVITYVLTLVVKEQANPALIAGAYTGALTSTPGLLAALEVLKDTPGETLVATGHCVAYPIGLITVILGMFILPRLTRINIQKEKTIFRKGREETEGKKSKNETKGLPVLSFSVLTFTVTIVVGLLIGVIPIPIPFIGIVNLGAGGVLLAGLIIGYIGTRYWPTRVGIEVIALSPIREVMMYIGLGLIGIRTGAGFVEILTQYGILLVLVGLVTGVGAITIGFIVARYIWHMNWVILSGALCGGMTSTPGMMVAIDAVEMEEPAAGYGGVYPVALICMIIFTKVLHAII